MSVMARTFRGTLMLNNAFRRTVLALRGTTCPVFL